MEGKKIAGQGKKQEEKLAQGWLKENQGRSEASFNRNFSYSEFIYIYTIYLKLKRSDGRRMIRKVEPRKDSCGSITDDSKKPLDRKLRRNFSHKMIPSILRGRRARKKKKEQITTTKGKKERKKENGTKEGKRGEYLSAFTVGEVALADRNVTRGRTCKRVIRFSGAGVSLRDSLCGQIWPRSPIVIIFWFSNVCHMAQLLAGAGPERLPCRLIYRSVQQKIMILQLESRRGGKTICDGCTKCCFGRRHSVEAVFGASWILSRRRIHVLCAPCRRI